MPFSRRHFLSTASLLVSGVALAPLKGLSATVRPRNYQKQVPLTDTDREVLAWVKSFATEVRLQGVSLLGKLRRTKRRRTLILANIPSADLLEAVLAGAQDYDISIYRSGDTITFTIDEMEYTIEALLPEKFQAKLDSLLTRLGVTFAADGITWNPDTLDLSDPFGATVTNALKLIFPGTGIAALFDTLLKGIDQADEANLDLGTSFEGFRRRVLTLAGRRLEASAEIAQQFITALPELAENLRVEGLVGLLSSPLISGVLGKELGVHVGKIIEQFKLLRLVNGVNLSDASVFLSSLLQDAIDLGSIDLSAANLPPLKQQRFAQALAQARLVRWPAR